ncbi:ImmA/IrrE family metallo-endopeptidase [Corynebacterium phocae]|nr:ImmA/IrrE family metallo-endopeptidase [Corynebacterium phocae]
MRNQFGGWEDWLKTERIPSLKELEKLATFTRVPFGYFFLPEPPVEELPIPDFRSRNTANDYELGASSELLDTIYISQRRQAWYEDYLQDLNGYTPLPFVGSAGDLSVEETARTITAALNYEVNTRAKLSNSDAVRHYLTDQFEKLGGLVMINSMVGNNTQRPLNLKEFRGFSLHSATAPLVFINAQDTKNGQIFSLLHEFAHIWRGESGVSQGGEPLRSRDSDSERWCDSVAAEIAVPATDVKRTFNPKDDLTGELERLARRYKCSTLVVLLRLRDCALLSEDGFWERYDHEAKRLLRLMASTSKAGGGDFYNSQPFRIGRKLSHAIIRDTQAGRTSMTEALRLLQFGRISMFDAYTERLGNT